MRVLIAGCGYFGKRLGERLLADGHEVWGLRRSIEGLKEIESAGLKLARADLGDPSTLQGLPDPDALIFCQAPSRNTDTYRATYVDGTRNLLASLAVRRGRKTLLVSSTSVYFEDSGGWVDEGSEAGHGPAGSEKERADVKALLEAESLVLSWPVKGVVLRLAGLYGPRRNRLKRLKDGQLAPAWTGSYTNRIHVDDAVAAARLLLERGEAGEIYIGADDEPSTQRDFYLYVCGRLRLDAAGGRGEPPAVSGKRCSNGKLKSLGFAPRYPSFREGYEALFREVG